MAHRRNTENLYASSRWEITISATTATTTTTHIVGVMCYSLGLFTHHIIREIYWIHSYIDTSRVGWACFKRQAHTQKLFDFPICLVRTKYQNEFCQTNFWWVSSPLSSSCFLFRSFSVWKFRWRGKFEIIPKIHCVLLAKHTHINTQSHFLSTYDIPRTYSNGKSMSFATN